MSKKFGNEGEDTKRRSGRGDAAVDFTREVAGSRRSGVPIFTGGEKAELRSHKFQEAAFDNVDFQDADLRESVFMSCSLRGAVFRGALLIGAKFINCDLRGADFDGSRLGGNRFDGTWLTGAVGLTPRAQHEVRASGGRFLRLIDGGLAKVEIRRW